MEGREKNIDAREKHQFVASHTCQDQGLHVSRPEGLNLKLLFLTGKRACNLLYIGLSPFQWAGRPLEIFNPFSF